MQTFSPDDKRMEELILYIAARSEDDPTYSKTKLNKLLFFSDFFAYSASGRPITGHAYHKMPHGPGPVAFLPVVERMAGRDDCEWIESTYFGRSQHRLVAKRGADLSWASQAEQDLIDELIDNFKGRSAREVSDFSHEFPCWQAVGMGETIPYETIFVLPPRPLTPAEIEHGQEVARNSAAS